MIFLGVWPVVNWVVVMEKVYVESFASMVLTFLDPEASPSSRLFRLSGISFSSPSSFSVSISTSPTSFSFFSFLVLRHLAFALFWWWLIMWERLGVVQILSFTVVLESFSNYGDAFRQSFSIKCGKCITP